jgi:3-deoxy-D-manno-octulosonic-acid transferase
MTTSAWYRLAIRIGAAVAPVIGLAHEKTRRGHRGREGALDRLSAWANVHRDVARPLVWFHASSVGEGLQAESVLQRLRQLRPDCQVVYTHFSPSAEELARRIDADISDYLPYDLPDTVRDLLDALRPDLLVFAKLDLWPELATQAAARGTPVALVAATVSGGSGRLDWPARALLAPGYAAVTLATAVSDDDAARLARLGVAPNRIEVLGDPRYDSVIARVNAVAPDDPLLSHGMGSATLVAGSTWPADEAVLLDAFVRLRTRRPEARLILVPHEPTPDHLANIEHAAARRGLPAPVRLGAGAAAEPAPLLLVDRMGVLAALYGSGGAAYVGGGFGRAGLHSVLEPAAWKLPMAFGPRWRESRDAGILLQAGAADAVSQRDPAGDLCRIWEGWIVNDDARRAQGRRARAVVDTGLGAADRTATSLLPLLRKSPSVA